MKKSFLQMIVCPLCTGALALESFDERAAGEGINEGVLECVSCTAHYPLIGGIPRLLPRELQSMLWETHREFFERHQARLPIDLLRDRDNQATTPMTGEDGGDAALKAQRETARSFGYEWQTFSEMLPDYEKNFRWYFERFSPDQFEGLRVLDAGCGTGRHTFHMARSGAREVVAMDFSQAIEVAARNNQDNPNTHFVQADIYHPPFPPGSFDFVYSLGVLHHLPDPEKGFRALLKLLRAGGFMDIYLYWNLETEAAWRRAALQAVTQARRLTTRLPHKLLQRVSWVAAAAFQVAFVLPSRFLDKFTQTRSLADRVPLGHYRKYSFRVLYTDQFDRLSAPIENRYGRAEVAAWFERARMREVVILGGAGWRASGRYVSEESSSTEKTDAVNEEIAALRIK